MDEQLLVAIDAAPPEPAAVVPAPAETSWRADIGDRICCAVFASASLVVVVWMLWTLYRLPAFR